MKNWKVKGSESKEYEVWKKDNNYYCNCIWGSLHMDNYKDGEKICKHIKQIIKEERKSDSKR